MLPRAVSYRDGWLSQKKPWSDKQVPVTCTRSANPCNLQCARSVTNWAEATKLEQATFKCDVLWL